MLTYRHDGEKVLILVVMEDALAQHGAGIKERKWR